MEHQTDLCLICDACLIVASMFRKQSTQCLSSNMLNYCGTVHWKWSRTSRNTHCFPCCGSCPSTPRWMGWTLDPFPGRPFNAARFGCVSNWWINCLTASLRVSSFCWTVECGNPSNLKSMLPPRTLCRNGFPCAFCWDGRRMLSLQKKSSILASIKQIRFECNSLR